jgi:hypothetical protein
VAELPREGVRREEAGVFGDAGRALPLVELVPSLARTARLRDVVAALCDALED